MGDRRLIERTLAGLLVVPFLLGAAAAPRGHAEVLFHFQDDDILEASALVLVAGLVVTSNDSGDSGRVFAVDPATGRTVGVTHWEDDPTDVEALAPGSGAHTVWVGDIGDNRAERSTVQLAQVAVGRGDHTEHPTVYDLAYPDGAHDAETLVTDPTTGRIYIATKDVFGGTLYAVPLHLSAHHVNRLVAVGPVLPIATDGAFFPDGRHLVIRNYGVATVYDFPSLQRLATVRLPSQPQGEGIGVTRDGSLLLDSEGRHSAVLKVALPGAVQRVVVPAPTTGSPKVLPGVGSSGGTPTTTPVAWWLLGGVVGLFGLAVVAGAVRRRR